MRTFIQILHILTCVALIIVVLMQTSKSEGLSGTLGGKATTSLGSKVGVERHLEVLTKWFAIGFFVMSLIAAWVR